GERCARPGSTSTRPPRRRTATRKSSVCWRLAPAGSTSGRPGLSRGQSWPIRRATSSAWYARRRHSPDDVALRSVQRLSPRLAFGLRVVEHRNWHHRVGRAAEVHELYISYKHGWGGREAGCMGPLHGYRVIELAIWVAGPAAASMLADWGADVIKVESPAGDPNRYTLRHIGVD